MATAPLVCNRDRDRIIAAAQEVCGLTDDEVIIYAAIFDAAERGAPCPTGEDLNDLTGRSSDSASRNVVERLADRKGLIRRDISNQRFRRVQVIATGKWTAASEEMRTTGNHMPRGTHDPKPLLKAMADTCEAAQATGEVVDTLKGLLRFETMVDRLKELIVRRKMHFLITPGGE
jgi:hypothetical protein